MALRLRVLTAFLVLCPLAVIASCSDQKNPEFTPLPPDEEGDGGTEGEDAGPTVITGSIANGIVLGGTVIGEDGPFEGQVFIGKDGNIACAEPGDACAKLPEAEGAATALDVGVIAPGLIDTHNHILFDIFDNSDWTPAQFYQNHDDWPKEQKYKEMVDVKQCLEDASQGKPAWCPAKFDGTANSLRCEMLKWGELKGLVAGTTSIVGLAGTSFPCFSSIARSIDTQFNGLDGDFIQTAAIFPSKATADGACRNFADGKTKAYLVHVGEGVDQKSRDELTKLGELTTTPGCLYAPQTVITHGTAFGATEWALLKANGMKLVWSPASNMALYNETTDIPAALDAGIVVALGPDWSMGGSPNMLDELRAAKKVSDTKWNGRLTAKDVVTMATKSSATVLALDDKMGTIKKGYLGDLFVVKGDRSKPYDAILAATPKDVRITMIGGKVHYGDEELRALAVFGNACDEIDACGAKKFVCTAVPASTENKLGQTFEQIQTALENALKDVDEARAVVGDGLKFAPLTPVITCSTK